jgi:uncharacterized protein (TIGR02611 family)
VRIATVVAGFAVVAGGIVLLPLPGPGWVIIFVGLALLSLEFDWAAGALEKALVVADRARIRAENATPAQKALSALLVVVVLAALGAWALWGRHPPAPGLTRGREPAHGTPAGA